jgi:hypothetical protein
MTQLLDYHVGILRGYMLALNAPTQVLNAVDILLQHYKSKAGLVIGEGPTEKQEPPSPKHVAESISQPSSERPPVEKEKHFWTADDDQTLERMYVTERAKPKKIAEVLRRTPASVSTRIAVRGLKREAV